MGFRASSDAWGQIVVRARSIQDEISHRVWLAQLASSRLATRTRCRGTQVRHVLSSMRSEIAPKRNLLQQSTLQKKLLPARIAVHTLKKTKGAITWDVCSKLTQQSLLLIIYSGECGHEFCYLCLASFNDIWMYGSLSHSPNCKNYGNTRYPH
jgi:hypothetical protein